MFMPNQFPGRCCSCGDYVQARQGKAEPPRQRGGSWDLACFLCMSPAEQEHSRRQAEHVAKLHREHADKQKAKRV